MRTPIALLALSLTAAASPALAFEGAFTGSLEDEPVVLELAVEGAEVRGELILDGQRGEVSARLRGRRAEGTAEVLGARTRIRLSQDESRVLLTLFDPLTGEEAETIVLHPQAAERPARRTRALGLAGVGGSRVVVNGRPVSEAQLAALQKAYGVRPRPGRYWYDARSGLYGVEGQPALGFMRAGHDLGPLAPGASRGDRPLYVNGRQLCGRELAAWAQLLGFPPRSGRYWLDANGDTGREGEKRPLMNLFAVVARRGVSPASGGDRFWTSRFAAGNSDAANRQGYVSVPGYGPVGYGF
jgi:hypothetical protein